MQEVLTSIKEIITVAPSVGGLHNQQAKPPQKHNQSENRGD